MKKCMLLFFAVFTGFWLVRSGCAITPRQCVFLGVQHCSVRDARIGKLIEFGTLAHCCRVGHEFFRVEKKRKKNKMHEV